MSKKQKRKIFNATSLPKRYFGLHMSEGVAHYGEEDPPKTIMLAENLLKRMDKTYEGRPVYVHHQDVEEVEDVEALADGYVIRSFYNECDGKHWTEFIAVSDAGQKAIEDGWQLSNAYDVLDLGESGEWHGVFYDSEVLDAEYDHLAITPSPRYKESIVLTPDEFKAYNEQKKKEIQSYQNSKTRTGVKSMFKFFQKQSVENSNDLESMSVLLPKSKKEVELSRLINEADERVQNADKPKFASASDKVKVNGEEMEVSDLVNKYEEMNKKKNEDDEDESQENESEDESQENEDESQENESEEEDSKESKKNSQAKPAGKKKTKGKKTPKVENDQENDDNESEEDLTEYEKIMNAGKENSEGKEVVVDLDGVSRGRSRYGS